MLFRSDVLAAIHDRILTEALAKAEELDLSLLGPLLDNFIDAATTVVVEGTVETVEGISATQTTSISDKFDISATASGVTAALGFASEAKAHAAQDHKVTRSGSERLRVCFGPVGREFERLVHALPKSQLWLVFDEWSEIPLDLQPYLADLMRRTVLPVRGVTVKIAAIEQRCNFRIADSAVGHIGIEIGADAAASISLDEFNDPWDSGQCGYAVLTKDDVKTFGFLEQNYDAILRLEVENYDAYLRGSVVYWVVTKKETCDKCGHTDSKVIDSLGGYTIVDFAKINDLIKEDVLPAIEHHRNAMKEAEHAVAATAIGND